MVFKAILYLDLRQAGEGMEERSRVTASRGFMPECARKKLTAHFGLKIW